MAKRYLIDGNGPGIVYGIDQELFLEFYNYLLDEGRCPYEISKNAAIVLVFEGNRWDGDGEVEYWGLDHCLWFKSAKEREENDRLTEEEVRMTKFELCYEEPYDRIEEPPIRKGKKHRGGPWLRLVNRKAA